MRLLALLFTATLLASPVAAQQPPASSAPSETEDTKATKNTKEAETALPVSVTKIRGALETTPDISLRTLDEGPTFRIQIKERQRIEELLNTLNFKAGPIPAGGVYMLEQNRVMFPSVDNPTRQPFGEFSQSQLLTILIENLAGKYLAGKTGKIFDSRARAEAAAKDEVRSAVAQYCGSQPNAGAGITICDTPAR